LAFTSRGVTRRVTPLTRVFSVTGLAVFSVEAVLMAIIESNKIHAPGPECNMQVEGRGKGKM
jgi:hypothetical protein